MLTLLFNRQTRRLEGSVASAPVVVPPNLIAVSAQMPAKPNFAYLDADNVTILTTPLSLEELAALDAAAKSVPPLPKAPISKLEFMSLFTDTELAAIFTAAKTNVAMEVWVEKLKAAAQVHLDNPATVAGVQALETAGLLAKGRAAVILK